RRALLSRWPEPSPFPPAEPFHSPSRCVLRHPAIGLRFAARPVLREPARSPTPPGFRNLRRLRRSPETPSPWTSQPKGPGCPPKKTRSSTSLRLKQATLHRLPLRRPPSPQLQPPTASPEL